jgi:hypothetical protein
MVEIKNTELIKLNLLKCLEGLTLKECKEVLRSFIQSLDNIANGTIIYTS